MVRLLKKSLELLGARKLLIIFHLMWFEVILIARVYLEVPKLSLRFDTPLLFLKRKDRLRFLLLVSHLLKLTLLEPSFPLSVAPLFLQDSVPLAEVVTCLVLDSFEFF